MMPPQLAPHDAPSIGATVYAAQYLNDSITLEQPQPMACSVCKVENTTSILTIPGSDQCPEGCTDSGVQWIYHGTEFQSWQSGQL